MIWIPTHRRHSDLGPGIEVQRERPSEAPGGRPTDRSTPADACRDQADRALLVPYAFSQCTVAEEVDFEAHLLECEACFQDLKCLDRAGALIREFRESSYPRREEVLRALRRQDPAARDLTGPPSRMP